MKVDVKGLKANIGILEERLKNINSRLCVDVNFVESRDVNSTDFWNSVIDIYDKNVDVCSQHSLLDEEWFLILHKLVLETVKKWQQDFGRIKEKEKDEINVNNIPKLEVNQLRLNINGDLYLATTFNSKGGCIRVCSLDKDFFDHVDILDYLYGEEKS